MWLISFLRFVVTFRSRMHRDVVMISIKEVPHNPPFEACQSKGVESEQSDQDSVPRLRISFPFFVVLLWRIRSSGKHLLKSKVLELLDKCIL